jgi:hypothetical protein
MISQYSTTRLDRESIFRWYSICPAKDPGMALAVTGWLDLEAPPGFEPGMEVLQSHPRFALTPLALAEFSPKSLCLKEITPFG